MIEKIVQEIKDSVNKLQISIQDDINDIKEAKHEELLARNDEKNILIEKITNLKQQLNNSLVKEIENGVDVNIYRQTVDELENKLKELYIANKKLASIVLPIQKMYKDLLEEIALNNGGNTFDIKA